MSKILVIQTAFVGDLLLGIPLLKSIRRLKPLHSIVLLCRKGLGDFLMTSGLVDSYVEVDKSAPESWVKATAELEAQQYELIICPHESPRSRFLVWRLHAKEKIGYSGFLNPLVFDIRIKRPMHLPEALRQLALLIPFDSSMDEKLRFFARLQTAPGGQLDAGLAPVPEWADMAVPRLLKLRSDLKSTGKFCNPSSDVVASIINNYSLQTTNPTVFIAPGSVWPTKMWTAAGYIELARHFLSFGKQVVLVGAPNERTICEDVARSAPGAISVAGKTSLYETAELFTMGEVLFSNDSGAMHMAAAAALPTVSMFGPTTLDFGYRPWQAQAVVAQIALPCRPCGSHGGVTCPIGTHDCMKKLPADKVLKVYESLHS